MAKPDCLKMEPRFLLPDGGRRVIPKGSRFCIQEGFRGRTKGLQVVSWHWITELMRVELIPNLGITRGTSLLGLARTKDVIPRRSHGHH